MNYDSGKLGSDPINALPDYAEKRSRRRWVVIGGVILILVALVGAWLIFRSSDDTAPVAKAPDATNSQIPTVTVVVPGRRVIERIISGTGSLAARREMPVGVAGEGGMVTRVLVEPGDWVGAGQVLATVDRSVQSQTAQSLAAQVSVARADADIAQSELDRASALVARGFISKADIDRKTATRDAALARVRVAQAQLAETRARNGRLDIRAPAAGLVLSRAVEPGQIISSGSPTLFRIAQGGQMEMRALLSEADLARVTVGIPATITPVGATRTFSGQVWQVSPVIDPQSRQGIARIAVAYDPALRPGGFASARLVAGGGAAPLLPESAVLSDARGNYVYILDGKDQAERRTVTVGEVSDAGVAIASGLSGSERVVLSAGGFLNPGQKVIPVVQRLKQ